MCYKVTMTKYMYRIDNEWGCLYDIYPSAKREGIYRIGNPTSYLSDLDNAFSIRVVYTIYTLKILAADWLRRSRYCLNIIFLVGYFADDWFN